MTSNSRFDESVDFNLEPNQVVMIVKALEKMEKSNDSGYGKDSIISMKCKMLRGLNYDLARNIDKKFDKECWSKRKLKKEYPKGTKFY